MAITQNIFLALILTTLAGCASEHIANDLPTHAPTEMSFFITSVGLGNGADLGGISGADAHCQTLGGSSKTWRAYLSTKEENARDRIGTGPWYNAKGVMIADSIETLHENNNLTKETALNEKGEGVNGRGDSPNRHDIMTGSKADGTLYISQNATDTTCNDWTSNTTGSARVGHHDRIGGGQDPASWNSAHDSRGCSQENLRSSGGDGLFYCFAIN